MRGTVAAPRDLGIRGLLRHRAYVLWLTAETSALLGFSAWSIAVIWLAYQVSGSIFDSALVIFVQAAIWASTSVAGPFVDRVRDRKKIYQVVLPAEGAIAVAVGLALRAHVLTIPALLAAVAAMSLMDDFWWTVNQTVPPTLLPRESLVRANGLAAATQGSSSIAGYSIGAVFLLLVGPEGSAFLFAALLGLAAVLLVPVRILAEPSPERNLWRSFRDGWRWLARPEGRPLLRLAGFFAATTFFSAAPPLLIELFASRRFAHPTTAYGILFTSEILGAVVAGLLISRLNPRRRLGPLIAGAVMAEGAAIALGVAVAPVLAPSALAWFLAGWAGGVPATIVYAYQQTVSPPGLLGRAISNLYLLPGIASSAGAVALGALVSTAPPATAGYGVALGISAVGAVGLLLPFLRRLTLDVPPGPTPEVVVVGAAPVPK